MLAPIATAAFRRRPGTPSRSASRAFTLIELLTAAAIFSLLLGFMVQMVGSVSHLYNIGRARSEANGTGRALLDAVAADLGHVIIHSDLASFAEQNDETSRALRFYCRRPGSGTQAGGLDTIRAASIVEYVFYRSGIKKGYLARRDRPCSWNSSLSVIPLGQTVAIPTLDAATEETLIYEGVVGAEWSYMRADGSVAKQFVSDSANPVVAIRYSLALLDSDSVRRLKATGRLDDVIGIFADSNLSGLVGWESILESHASSFPKPVIEGLRFYERFVPLPEPAH